MVADSGSHVEFLDYLHFCRHNGPRYHFYVRGILACCLRQQLWSLSHYMYDIIKILACCPLWQLWCLFPHDSFLSQLSSPSVDTWLLDCNITHNITLVGRVHGLPVHPVVYGVQPVVGVPGHGVWRRRRQPVDDWNIKHKITFTQSQPLTVSANKNSVVHRGYPKQEHHTTHHQHQAAVTTSCKHFYNLVVALFTFLKMGFGTFHHFCLTFGWDSNMQPINIQ